jgi:hypothetical protein
MSMTDPTLPPTNIQERFIRRIIEGSTEPGYIEIIAGYRLPSHPARIRMATATRKWFWCQHNGDLTPILSYITTLQQTYTDIYASYHLYRTPIRSIETAIDSRIIFIDDVPPVPPPINGHRILSAWAWYIQTSPDRGHGYIVCTHAVSAEDRTIITRLLGGDPSGSDTTQLVRVPDTANSKYTPPYPVRMIEPPTPPPAVTVETMIGKQRTSATPHRSTRPHDPRQWANLPDSTAILQSRRMQHLLPHRPQLAAILRGERVTLLRGGIPDSSDSSQVASLVYHLIGANFPEREIRAIALALHPMLRPDRPLPRYRQDIDREIERYRTDRYRPTPTIQHRQTASHRTRRQAVQRYWTWLQHQAANGMVLLSQRECAESYQRSVRTIKRYEHTLRAWGYIQRAPFGRRHYGRLIITAPHHRRGTKPSCTVPTGTPEHHHSTATRPVHHRGATQTPSRPSDGTPHPTSPPSTRNQSRAQIANTIRQALRAAIVGKIPLRNQYRAVRTACHEIYTAIGERTFRILYRDARDRENLLSKPPGDRLTIMAVRKRWYEYTLTRNPDSPITYASYHAWMRAYECVYHHPDPPG